MFERILLTVDGSPFAEQAIPYAKALAKCQGASIHVLRVAPAIAPIDFPVGSAAYQQLLAHELTAAQKYVDDLVVALRAEGLQADGEVLLGDPAALILEAASRANCSVIVMATHGRSGLSRLVFGSVADQVLRGSPIPVLMVRAAETPSAAPTARAGGAS
ncbi:MAG: universal stress protein [Chloroflexota bacterium]|nr:universal stress protein [Chloroflexota bacterium]